MIRHDNLMTMSEHDDD